LASHGVQSFAGLTGQSGTKVLTSSRSGAMTNYASVGNMPSDSLQQQQQQQQQELERPSEKKPPKPPKTTNFDNVLNQTNNQDDGKKSRLKSLFGEWGSRFTD